MLPLGVTVPPTYHTPALAVITASGPALGSQKWCVRVPPKEMILEKTDVDVVVVVVQ